MIPALVQADLASEKMNGKLKHYIPHIVSEWYEETKHKKNEHRTSIFCRKLYYNPSSSRFEGNIGLARVPFSKNPVITVPENVLFLFVVFTFKIDLNSRKRNRMHWFLS